MSHTAARRADLNAKRSISGPELGAEILDSSRIL